MTETQGYSEAVWRPITRIEREAIECMLDGLPAEFAVYREQLDELHVEAVCKCGCGTAELVPGPGAPLGPHKRAIVDDGYTQWSDGERGDVILFIEDGKLGLLEYVAYHVDDAHGLKPVRHWTGQPRRRPSGTLEGGEGQGDSK